MLVHPAFRVEMDPNNQARPGPVECAGAAAALERGQGRGGPRVAENSKEAYSAGLDALAWALKGYFDSRSGERKGRRIGFPRFHTRGSRRSYRITTGAFGVLDEGHVRLPRIGPVRAKEPTVKRRRQPRYREWPGNRPGRRPGERTGRGEVHGLAQVLLAEPSRRHQPNRAGQDRHRHPATGGSGTRPHRK